MPTPHRLRLLAWLLFLKVDDAAVVADVDGEALSTEGLDLAVDGFTETVADLVELLVEESLLSLVWLHL